MPSIQPIRDERCCSRGTAPRNGRFRVWFPAVPWKFSSDLFLRSALCRIWVHPTSNRNEYNRQVKLTNPPS